MLSFAYNTNGAANHRLEDAIDLIAESGYDGVALTLDHHHLDPFAEDWQARAGSVARRLRAHGLGVVIETGARYLLDPRDKHEPTFVSVAPEGRARRLAFLKRAADIGGILGAEALSFWAGVPKPGVDAADARTWLIENLHAIVDHARSAGVTPAFEPEPGMLIETCAEWQTLDIPGLMLALDTGHCLVTQDIDPAEAVCRYAPHLGTVAIEDMKRGVHVHLPFGEGDMHIPEILAALREVGYNKLVCVELSRESPQAHRAIPQSLAWLRAHGA